MLATTTHVPVYGWIALALLILGFVVVVYWFARLLGFIVRAPFRALGRPAERKREEPSRPGLGSEYEQLVLANADIDRKQRPRRTRSAYEGPAGHRSKLEAAALTFVIALAGLFLMAGVLVIVRVVAGTTLSLLAFLVTEVAVLAFVTSRAYPPGSKRPMVLFGIITLLLSALIPLIYLSWLWMTGKKGTDQQPTAPQPTAEAA